MIKEDDMTTDQIDLDTTSDRLLTEVERQQKMGWPTRVQEA